MAFMIKDSKKPFLSVLWKGILNFGVPMKVTKNLFIWLAVLFFSCFLIYTYWETVVSICNTIYIASQPFLVGAGIALVVNILMSF